MTRVLAAFLLAALSASGWCQSAAGPLATGKVEGVYVKLAEGVYLETRRAPRTASRSEIWVDARFAGDSPNGRRFALARVADLNDVEVGDLVEVEFAAEAFRVAGGTRDRIAPLAQAARVTTVAAKHFTPAAQAFGAAPRALELELPRMPRPIASADTF